MTSLQFIVLALATWRISSLLVREDGPFFVFRIIRKRFGIVHDDNGVPYQYPDGFMPQLLSCVWCTSVWMGFGWLAFFLIFPDWATKTAAAFSFSTVAIVLDKYINR